LLLVEQLSSCQPSCQPAAATILHGRRQPSPPAPPLATANSRRQPSQRPHGRALAVEEEEARAQEGTNMRSLWRRRRGPKRAWPHARCGGGGERPGGHDDGGRGLAMKNAMVSSIFSPLLSLSWAAVLRVMLFTSPVLHHLVIGSSYAALAISFLCA
jgi:hypothetical protein